MSTHQSCVTRMKIILLCILFLKVHLSQGSSYHSNLTTNLNRYLIDNGADCWSSVNAILVNDCEELSDYGRAFIALQMTKCFLNDFSKELTLGCDSYEDIRNSDAETLRKCTSNMNDSSFKIYSQFSTHVTSFCLGQKEMLIRKKWERIINNLIHISEMSSSAIGASIEIQNEIIHLQMKTVEQQYQTIDEVRSLERSIKNYSVDVGDSYAAINGYLTDFKILIDKTLKKTIMSLQPLIEILYSLFGEMMRFDTIYFYMAVFTASIFLTWNYDTNSARNTLIALLVGTLFGEITILKVAWPIIITKSMDFTYEKQLIVFAFRLNYIVILFSYCYYVLCSYWKEWISVCTTIQNTKKSLIKIDENNKFLLGCSSFMRSLYEEVNNHYDKSPRKKLPQKTSTMIKHKHTRPVLKFEPNISEIK